MNFTFFGVSTRHLDAAARPRAAPAKPRRRIPVDPTVGNATGGPAGLVPAVAEGRPEPQFTTIGRRPEVISESECRGMGVDRWSRLPGVEPRP